MKKMREKIGQLIAFEGRKSLANNILSLSVLKLLNLIIPLFMFPYVIKTVGLSKYGAIVLASSLLNYFITITDFSFNITATREVALNKNNKKKLQLIYSKVTTVQFLFLLLSFCIYFFLVNVVTDFQENKLVFYFMFISLVGKAFFPDWFFQGMENMKYITIIDAIAKSIFVIGVIFLVRKESDYYLYPLLLGISSLISAIFGQAFVFFQYRLRFKPPSFVRVRKTIVDNFGIFVNQFLPQLYNNSATLILGFMTNVKIVGIYGALKAVTEVGIMLLNILSTAFFPHLNRNRNDFKKFANLLVGFGIALFVGLCSITVFVLTFLEISFSQAWLIFLFLSLSLPFSAMYLCYGVNYFLVKQENKLVVKNTVAASLIGFVLSFPLIWYLGAVGAALNVTMSRAIMGLRLAYKYRQSIGKKAIG